VYSVTFSPPRPRFNAHIVQQVNPLSITYSIHSYIFRPCLELHMPLQHSQTPSYPVKISASHWKSPQTYTHRPPALHSKHWSHHPYHPPTYSQMFTYCPSHPNTLVQQLGNYTLADLTNMYRKYQHQRTLTAIVNLEEVSVSFFL